MAKQLNANLLSSLKKDLYELQDVGLEMMSKIENCEIKSWRYPNQFIQDVKINVYNTAEQLSEKYILLLELTIDRLYFVLSLALEHLEAIPKLSQFCELPKNVCRPKCLSFGVLVYFFWKRLQILIERNTFPPNSGDITSRSVGSSQTDFGCFGNCESCHTAMQAIKILTKGFEECMFTLNLQSSITKQRLVLNKTLPKLSQFGAMEQWSTAIIADAKSLIETSKKKFSENLDLIDDFQNMKKENDRNVKKFRHLQAKYEELEELNSSEETKNFALSKLKNDLEIKCNKMREDLVISSDSIKTNQLKIQMLENTLKQNNCENMKTSLEIKMNYTKQIQFANVEKNSWIEMYTQSKKYVEDLQNKLKMEQAKQREDELKRQEEHKRDRQLLELESEKKESLNKLLMEKVEQLEKKLLRVEDEFNVQISTKIQEVEKLNKELIRSKEREMLLLRCPDLNSPMAPIYDAKVTKNPLQDMEQQIEANQVRINLLESQNNSLRRTTEKLKALTSVPGR